MNTPVANEPPVDTRPRCIYCAHDYCMQDFDTACIAFRAWLRDKLDSQGGTYSYYRSAFDAPTDCPRFVMHGSRWLTWWAQGAHGSEYGTIEVCDE